MANSPYVGDEGTKISVDVGINADNISLAKLIVKKPSGTVVEWTAIPESGTTTIYYITGSGDLDKAGRYYVQAYVETSDWKGHGAVTSFTVYPNLQS